MKAFLISIVALVVITGAAVVITNGTSETSQQAYTSDTGNVRH